MARSVEVLVASEFKRDAAKKAPQTRSPEMATVAVLRTRLALGVCRQAESRGRASYAARTPLGELRRATYCWRPNMLEVRPWRAR